MFPDSSPDRCETPVKSVRPFVYPCLAVKIRSCVAALFFLVSTAACRTGGGNPAIIQPGAPGQAGKVIGAAQATDLSKVQATAADVKFMQGMIGHHAQAIEMVALLKTRSTWEDMKKLGMRIEVSQEDEIRMMQRWLEVRGQPLPDPHAHHKGDQHLMPGMLTADEMGRLGAAKGAEFDRLFLEGMIKHHGGALLMVEELFASPGAAQESDIYAFASDVVADQRMEMDRMAGMLKELQK
jgi:uncharacterized protein (DUF305 family)